MVLWPRQECPVLLVQPRQEELQALGSSEETQWREALRHLREAGFPPTATLLVFSGRRGRDCLDGPIESCRRNSLTRFQWVSNGDL